MWYILLIAVPIFLVIFGTVLIERSEVPKQTKIYTSIDDAYNKTHARISYQDKCNTTVMSNETISCEHLKKYIQRLESDSANISYTLSNIASTTFAKYLYHKQMAIVKLGVTDMSATEITLYYNDTYLHSMPYILNKVSNWIGSMYNISAIYMGSKPYQTEEPVILIPETIRAGIIIIGLSMNIIPTGLAFDIVEDRTVSICFSFLDVLKAKKSFVDRGKKFAYN